MTARKERGRHAIKIFTLLKEKAIAPSGPSYDKESRISPKDNVPTIPVSSRKGE